MLNDWTRDGRKVQINTATLPLFGHPTRRDPIPRDATRVDLALTLIAGTAHDYLDHLDLR